MAVITDIVERLRQVLERTIETRAAPSDEVHLAVSLTMMNDEDGDETAAFLVFLAVTGEEMPETLTLTARFPCATAAQSGALQQVADSLWDRLQSRRMAKTFEAMGMGLPGPEDVS